MKQTDTTRHFNWQTTAVVTLLCILIAPVFAYLGWQAMLASIGPATLPEPGPRVSVSPNKVDIVIATALQHGSQAEITKNLVIQISDQGHFKHHLFNIAHQRGWYAHRPHQKGLNLVLPRKDLPQLDQMTHDPIPWTLTNIDPTRPAKGPSNSDLAHVKIVITSPANYLWFGTAAIVLWIVSSVAIVTPAVLWNNALFRRLEASN